MTDAIQVAVRVRPLSRAEVEAGQSNGWMVNGHTIVAADARDTKYTLDHVFGAEWTTAQIYEKVAAGLLAKVISGFNGTVFAYGQTSSGKTYTMRGGVDEPGIIPLAVAGIFRLIDACQDREFLLRVSYMELYNEEVNDLLAPQNVKLPVHESRECGVYVCGLREDIVTCPEAVLALLEQGEANRHIGSTRMNEKSSRSHTIFRMVVESRVRDSESADAAAILVSTLTLVDLAGSERVAKTGAEGLRMKEGTAINKSLLTLGNVINKLSEGVQSQAGGHIPYRDSKLTRILQPSLGGNAKTAIIAAMTPAGLHSEESHSTLRFACRAKRVVNNAVINEVLSDAAVLKRQAHEIEELKRKLSAAGMTVEVEEQIGALRGQLLRSEQEKELMRLKLEEERVEREKAQKQAEVAKKMMLEGGAPADSGDTKRSLRRGTWCPGRKGGWAAPALGQGDDSEGPLSAAAPSTVRKRPLSQLAEDSGLEGSAGGAEGGDEVRSALRATVIPEEGEDEDDAAAARGGPTPQRPRRVTPPRLAGDDNDEADEWVLADLSRLAATLKGSDRATVEFAACGWQAAREVAGTLQDSLAALEASIEETTRLAAERAVQLEAERDAVATERDRLAEEAERLVPVLEKERWLHRQAEKKLIETTAELEAARVDRERLAAEVSALRDVAQANEAAMASTTASHAQERATLQEQVSTLELSLSDAREGLALAAKERGIQEAKARAATSEAELAAARAAERSADVEALTKRLQAAQEAGRVLQAQLREAVEAQARLQAHVADLESRKRAPLYQKKQEEELRAAVDKAADAEARAKAAEAAQKLLEEKAETGEKRVAELEAGLERVTRTATEAAADVEARHALELQRVAQERAKQQAQAEERLARSTAQLEGLSAALVTAEEGAAQRDARITELQTALEAAEVQRAELETNTAELQGCMSSASARIAQLEEEAEATEAAHNSAVAALTQQLAASEARVSDLGAELDGTREALATRTAELLAQLEALAARSAAAFEEAAAASAAALAEAEAAGEARVAEIRAAADTAAAEAARVQQGYRSQIDGLNAKLIEAAGALRAKEELKEERLKHKQEVATLRAEVQKLSLESKTGAKGKELAGKELETLKKRVGEMEAKLKTALQDKAAALQEKGRLEGQLKQYEGQKAVLQKSLEKQGAIENKKRESIMVNLTKKEAALSTVEDRLKAATVELQKAGADLEAKRSECTALEQQVESLEGALAKARAEGEALAMELTRTQHGLECAQQEHQEAAAQHAEAVKQLEEARDAGARDAEALRQLKDAHGSLAGEAQATAATLASLRLEHAALTAQHAEAATALAELRTAHATLMQQADTLSAQLCDTQVALSAAQDARIAAESRVPEIEELQRQLSTAHEQLSDAAFQLAEAKERRTADAAAAVAAIDALRAELAAANTAAAAVRAALAEAQAQRAALDQQLEQTVELYMAVQARCEALEEAQRTAQESAATAAECATAHAAQTAALQDELRSSRAEAEALRAEVSAAASRMASVEERAAATASELAAATSAQTALASELAAAQASAADAAARLQVANEQLADMASAAAEAAELRAQMQQMAQEMSEAEFEWHQERATLQERVTKLQADLDGAARGDVTPQPSQASVAAEAAAALQAALEAARADAAQAAAAQAARTRALEEELSALRTGCLELKGELQCLFNERNQLTAQLAELQAKAGAADDGDTVMPATQPDAAFGSPVASDVAPTQATRSPSPAGPVGQATMQLAALREAVQARISGGGQAATAKKVGSTSVGAEATARLAAAEAEAAEKDAALAEACQAYSEVCCQLADAQLQVQELEAALKAAQAALPAVGSPAAPRPVPDLLGSEVDLAPPQAPVPPVLASTPTRAAAHLLERITQLEQEAAEAQAAANCARAEKLAAERAASSRLLQMERRILELSDELSAVQAAGGNVAVESLVGAHPGLAPGRPTEREEQLSSQVAALKLRLDQAAAARAAAEAAARSELAASREETGALRAAVDGLSERVEALSTELAAVTARGQALAAQLAAAQQRETAGSKCDQRDAAVTAAAAAREAEAHAALVDARAHLGRVTAQLADAQQAHAAEAEARRSLSTHVARLEDEVAVHKAAAQAAVLDAEAARADMVAVKAAAATATQKLQGLEQERWVAQDAAIRTQRQLESMAAQLAAAQEELADLAPRLEHHQASQAATEAKAVELEAQLKATQQRCGTLTEAVRGAEAKVSTRDAEWGSKVQQLQARLESLQQEHAQVVVALEQAQPRAASGGPTAQQQALMAHMAARLEALEEGHRRELEALQEEVLALGAAREAAAQQSAAQLADVRQAAALALEEAEWAAKSKEAELNARVLSLESQIHWLGEQNAQLQAALAGAAAQPGQGAPQPLSHTQPQPAPAEDLAGKCAALESDLRRAKRAELKLQALLFRLRKDVEDGGGDVTALDRLREVRSLEYDVDLLTQKLKRAERQIAVLEADRAGAGFVNVGAVPALKPAVAPLAGSSTKPTLRGRAVADKENQPAAGLE